MAVDFLTKEQKAQYGQFCGEPNDIQLIRYFHLDEADKALITNRRGNQNKLGFALHLTTVRFLGTFLSNLSVTPINVQYFVAKQLSITDLGVLTNYAQRETTKREHTALIRQHYGYHEFNHFPWSFRLSRLLYTRTWLNNERPSMIFDFATAWLIQNKILLPGVSTLTRLIAEIRERTTNKLWKRLASLPSEAQKEKLEALLLIPEGERTSQFDYFRKGPVRISSPAFILAVERFQQLKRFNIQSLNFNHIPPVRLKSLARYAGTISVYKIARMPKNKRIALLVAFVKSFEILALDDAIDILDLLLTEITNEAKRIDQKKRLRTLKDLDQSALQLAAICSLILDEKTEDSELRARIYQKISKTQLAQSIEQVNAIARPSNEGFQTEMLEQYSRVKRLLPRLFNDIKIQAAPAGLITHEAFLYLANRVSSRKQILDDPPLGIISKPWKKLVFDEQGRITKKGYTLCFLDKLQDSLRRRDVYIENSDRWGDPRAKLLQDNDWQSNRIKIYRSLGHHIQPDEAIAHLTSQLDKTYKQVSNNFGNNAFVKLDNAGKRTTLTITNLDKLDEPASLIQLSDKVMGLLPKVDLTELLLEIHAHTHFLDEFIHVSESNARADDLATSICAMLISEACNIGLEPLVKSHIPALSRHRLSWVKQNYLRAETLVQANVKLVDYQSTLSLAQKWGGGHVASADGMRFVTPIKTVHAGYNKKYFGANRGITWYNFISDQYSGFHGIVIPGTLRDSLFVLEGLLEQQTGLKPTEIMVDTTGTSDIVFGLFWLLGYQFSPRLADAGEAVFWRIDKNANYGLLDTIARGVIQLKKIEQHWDDMMRIAGSLKLGMIHASELIRSLLKSDRPSSLTQAIIEVGRINKTLYLLNYIDNEDYRRKILTQLNRGEARHAVARMICHGQRGEIRKRYREGQEDQLGALGLVTNAVILWNTIYMQSALDYLRGSMTISADNESRLSPLVYRHINVLGHYSFTLSEQVMNGKLRPLSQNNDNRHG